MSFGNKANSRSYLQNMMH